MTLIIIIGCFILALLLVGGIVALVIMAKQGGGVSDARQGWIEGSSYEDDP
ncbi:MAG: hypothetical protein AAF629_06345 [Chloroflexota bacterium]